MNISNYYYQKLGEEQKIIYDFIYDGINNLSGEILLPLTTSEHLYETYNSVLLDNPIFFYTKSYQYLNDYNNQRMVLMPLYKYTSDFINQSTEMLSDYLRLFDTVKNETDVNKELYIHDFCLSNFTYDHDFNEYSFSILGLVLLGNGVCEGISKFIKVALNYLGIDCMVVSGSALNPMQNFRAEPHMWNIVSINNRTYHLDVTFNMSQTGKINRYDYFNLSDNDIKKDRTITERVPICNTVGKDYYTANALTVENFVELEGYIKKSLRKSESIIVFKYTGNHRSNDIINKVNEIITRQSLCFFPRQIFIEVKYNPSQLVFEIQFN